MRLRNVPVQPGKSAAQFVRECFEDPSTVAKTPAVPYQMPIPYPNVSKLGGPGRPQLAGGLSKLPNMPVSGPATAGDAESDAIMFAIVRAAILDQNQDIAKKYKDESSKLKSQREEVSQRYQHALKGAQTELLLGLADGLTQAQALLQLIKALAAVFGLSFATAFFMVMRQAVLTIQWQMDNTSPANLVKIVGFAVRVILAAQQVYVMSMAVVLRELDAMVPDIYAKRAAAGAYAGQIGVLSTTILITCVIITVTLATFGAGPSVTTALMSASVATIAAAVATVIKAGATVDVVARAGLALFNGRIRDFEEAICKGWSVAASQRSSLVDLVRALNRVIGVTLERITELLVKARSIDFGAIANALVAEFGRDASRLARAFRAAGAGMHDVAVALKNAGFSAVDTGRALKDGFNANRADVVQTELANAGYRADEVANAIRDLFRTAADTARSFIGGIG